MIFIREHGITCDRLETSHSRYSNTQCGGCTRIVFIGSRCNCHQLIYTLPWSRGYTTYQLHISFWTRAPGIWCRCQRRRRPEKFTGSGLTCTETINTTIKITKSVLRFLTCADKDLGDSYILARVLEYHTPVALYLIHQRTWRPCEVAHDSQASLSRLKKRYAISTYNCSNQI